MSLDLAIKYHKQGKFDMAEKEYYLALEDKPDDANATYLLGTLFLQKKCPGLSTILFQKAISIKPDHFEALNNLGNCHMHSNRAEEAKFFWEAALSVPGKNPDEYSDLWNNLATLYVNAGNPQEGMKYALKAIELNPAQPDANWNLALLMLEQGQYGDGFDKYYWGMKTKNRLIRNYNEAAIPWDGSEDKNIIVWGEQGIGDELMFASMIPDLMKVSNKVVFDCHPRLVKIFRKSFPGLAIYGTRKDEFINWTHEHPDINAKISIGDLGKFFRRNVDDFPKTSYLKAEEFNVNHWKAKLNKMGDRLKVGISWTGGYKKTRKDYRSIPLELWKPILECDADFFSLQYTAEAYQSLAEIEEATGVRVHHWPSAVQNDEYHETAAFVEALDLVITVNTAVHHLAGGLGKECWTLTPKAHAWRYWSPDKDGHSIPWYPNCYQYMQKNLFDWQPIMQTVSRRLRGKIRTGVTEVEGVAA